MITFRKPTTSEEEDWANDDMRWLNEREYPEDYLGSCYERAILADVDGVRCVVKIMAPTDGLTHKVEDALFNLSI